MASVNKVILIGNLGADPEMRYTQNNTPVANFRIATTDQWSDKQTGERQERTEWHTVVAWARLAEICHQYLRKGKQVYIEGRLQTRKYTDKDGQERYKTEIVAQTMQMLGRPSEEERGQAGAPRQREAGAGAGAGPAQGGAPGGDFGAPPPEGGPEDDLPF